jgi:hypothetical protein
LDAIERAYEIAALYYEAKIEILLMTGTHYEIARREYVYAPK